MAERVFPRTVLLAGLLIALLGISTLLVAAIASIRFDEIEGDKILGDQVVRETLHATRPFKIDREVDFRVVESGAVASDAPKQQVTQKALKVEVEPGTTAADDNGNSNPDDSTDNTSPGIYSSNPNLELYADGACKQVLTSLDWGTIYAGGSVTRNVYVKNTGDSAVTLTLSVTNWRPASANGPLTLTWNKEGVVLGADQVLAASLTLSVSSSISGITSFDVDVVISGTA